MEIDTWMKLPKEELLPLLERAARFYDDFPTGQYDEIAAEAIRYLRRGLELEQRIREHTLIQNLSDKLC